MLGLMQDCPLTVDRLIDHAARWHGGREVVSRTSRGDVERTTYAEIAHRARRLSTALQALGISPGDRVATMAWNGGRHLEAWYAIMGIGAVCHTVNPRLFVDQIVYILNHAEDRILLIDTDFAPLVAQIRSRLPKLEHVVLMAAAGADDAELPGALLFETLIAEAPGEARWGGFDERLAAGLCYTSGTTGNPRGVLYSHRSNFLQTLTALAPDLIGLSATDVVMPVVPMFHANAWSLAFSCPAVGAKMVMPGSRLDGASVHELLESEGVTFSAAVPTVWQMLLTHLRDSGGTLSTLKRVVIGGSAVPESIVRGFEDEYGVIVSHAWGMTETSPVGTYSTPTAGVLALDPAGQFAARMKQGRPPPLLDMKLTDDDGARLPHDGSTFGNLKVKGPYVASHYYRDDSAILDEEGYFDTGDVATIDGEGFMHITDRAKDVIKSGGEWISSIEIENIAVAHPKAKHCAVIGVPHAKWDERPILLVATREGAEATKEEFLAFLEGKIARWWMPDDVLFLRDIPLNATGKIDKKQLRALLAEPGR